MPAPSGKQNEKKLTRSSLGLRLTGLFFGFIFPIFAEIFSRQSFVSSNPRAELTCWGSNGGRGALDPIQDQEDRKSARIFPFEQKGEKGSAETLSDIAGKVDNLQATRDGVGLNRPPEEQKTVSANTPRSIRHALH